MLKGCYTMKSDFYYLTYNQIQDQIDTVHKDARTKLTFKDAVINLHRNGQTISDSLCPYNTTNNYIDIKTFKQTIYSLPIDVTPIISNPGAYLHTVTEMTFPFHSKDITPFAYMYFIASEIHEHDFFEITYVLEGECHKITDTEKILLKKGAFCITAPNTKHDIILESDSLVIGFSIKKSTFESTFFHLLKNDNIMSRYFYHCLYHSTQNSLLFMLSPTNYIYEVIKYIFFENNTSKPYSNEICNNYTEILFSEVMRNYSSYYTDYSTKDSAKAGLPAILTYIKNNYRTITLKELAEYFNYDSSYLGKQIKKNTGMYFNDIITKYKIDYSLKLLNHTSLSIEDIAETVGYHSADHFSRSFKKKMNLSPRQYRTNEKARIKKPSIPN